ncbi:short chain aldehyde dehydrogenase 1-like [Mercurialis annua]|uniref:short chain aldehyde dehydrogenase 1-like n=1 Tax=Mercurialis annua TaxID=3986 RepID=UPI002160C645|nr:short chain aldehyde dehydrogenase 1-like [Mercurialis annua]
MAGSSLQALIAKRLEGRVALITGGAAGIGETTARLFAKHGAKVVIADINSKLGQSVASQIQSEFKQPVSYVNCDVTNETDVENAVNTAVSLHGKLDIMFNNAGIASRDKRIESVDGDTFRRVMDINVYGGFLGAKHASRVMIPEKKGCILFSASAASLMSGGPYAYTASKHAVVGLTKNLAVELGKFGIRVNCISTIFVPTPLAINGMNLKAEQVQAVSSSIACLKEVKLEAGDIAEAALYLASDESKFISGLNLVVDGAATLAKI